MTSLPPFLTPGHHKALIDGLTDPVMLEHLKRFRTDFATDQTTVSDDQATWMFERGFLPEKTELYDFAAFEPALFLSDFQRWLTREVNGDYAIVFNNKILFTQVFRNFCKVAPVNAIWRNNRVISYDGVWERCLAGEMTEPRKFVIKPLGGGGGGNVYFVTVDSRRATIESNEPGREHFSLPVARMADIFKTAHVPFMVNEFIYQGAYSRSLYPRTVNTVRMLVVRDPETLQPHVVRTVQRIGTASSYPIDNFTLGGLSAEIDVETGVLGPAVAAAEPHKGQKWDVHPNTGEPIAGQVVPNWPTVIKTMKSLFLQIPYISYCGFDLILQDDDVLVLEGNSFSQVRLFQMHRPLLTDPIYVKVLRHHGIYVPSSHEETVNED